jgi:hypothetical protein
MKKKHAILSFAVLGALLIVYVLFYKVDNSRNQMWHGAWITGDGAMIEFRRDGSLIDYNQRGFEADSATISESELVLKHNGTTQHFPVSDVHVCGDHAFRFTANDTVFVYIGDSDFSLEVSDLTSHEWTIHGIPTNTVLFGTDGSLTIDNDGSISEGTWSLREYVLAIEYSEGPVTTGAIDHVARCRGKAMVMTFDNHGVAWMDVSLR